MSGALTRYRVMAWVVGVLLLLLVFVHIPLRIIWDIHTPVAVLHGWMFMIYVVTVIDLAMRCRWPIFPRTFLIALAGTIPFFLLLMVLIVVCLFNSLRITAIIWLTVPLALIGVVSAVVAGCIAVVG